MCVRACIEEKGKRKKEKKTKQQSPPRPFFFGPFECPSLTPLTGVVASLVAVASEGVAVEVAFGVLPEQERFAVAQPRPEHQNARERVLRRPREGRGHVLVEAIR